MRDFICKTCHILYCFLGYADMRLILGYESGVKGCARISFNPRAGSARYFLDFLHYLVFLSRLLYFRNITSLILIAKNPLTLTLICHYAISLDLRLSSLNPRAKRRLSFRAFLSLCALDERPVPRPPYT